MLSPTPPPPPKKNSKITFFERGAGAGCGGHFCIPKTLNLHALEGGVKLEKSRDFIS